MLGQRENLNRKKEVKREGKRKKGVGYGRGNFVPRCPRAQGDFVEPRADAGRRGRFQPQGFYLQARTSFVLAVAVIRTDRSKLHCLRPTSLRWIEIIHETCSRTYFPTNISFHFTIMIFTWLTKKKVSKRNYKFYFL